MWGLVLLIKGFSRGKVLVGFRVCNWFKFWILLLKLFEFSNVLMVVRELFIIRLEKLIKG